MKITYSIKVNSDNIEAIEALPCVASVTHTPRGTVVRLHSSSTRGRTEAVSGEWLVLFACGLWQRFGHVAYDSMLLASQKKNEYEQ